MLNNNVHCIPLYSHIGKHQQREHIIGAPAPIFYTNKAINVATASVCLSVCPVPAILLLESSVMNVSNSKFLLISVPSCKLWQKYTGDTYIIRSYDRRTLQRVMRPPREGGTLKVIHL